jgi:hypothetical protein
MEMDVQYKLKRAILNTYILLTCAIVISSGCTSLANCALILDNRISDSVLAYSNTWTNMTAGLIEKPFVRGAHAMAYDSQNDKIIMFGGIDSSHMGLNDTWAYDFNTNTWKNMNPVKWPSARAYHAMAYDSESDRTILFGGYYSHWLCDTWAYDFHSNTWTNMSPIVKPPSRSEHALTYDSRSDRIILFGGGGERGVALDDTWAYDYNSNTWTNITPIIKPIAVAFNSLAYDSESDRTILFGGWISGIRYSNDTWAYDYNNNTWTNMNPSLKPSNRGSSVMVYDSVSDRIILFGGGQPKARNNETWMYDFNTNAWKNMTQQKGPPARWCAAMAYDNESNRAILFDGYTGSQLLDDTWAYELNKKLTPPNAVSTTPKNGETNVPIDANIVITFSDSMNRSVTENAISSVPAITGQFSWDSMAKTLTWNPNVNLTMNTQYTITITTSAKSQTNVSMASPYIFIFTTGILPDTIPPIVISTIPFNGTRDYNNKSNITVIFSEAMNKTQTESAIYITPGSLAKKEWNVNGTILTLVALLEEGTTYVINISTKAEDLAGNKMENAYSFSFMTKSTNNPNGKPNAELDLTLLVSVTIFVVVTVVFFLLFLYMRKKPSSKKPI